MDTTKYLALFASEASERLREFEENLLKLERAPTDRAAIDAAFRQAHSIKGMAATMGFAGLVTVVHCVEELMDIFRNRGAADPGGSDLLVAAADAMGAYIQAVSEGRPPPSDELSKTICKRIDSTISDLRAEAEVGFGQGSKKKLESRVQAPQGL